MEIKELISELDELTISYLDTAKSKLITFAETLEFQDENIGNQFHDLNACCFIPRNQLKILENYFNELVKKEDIEQYKKKIHFYSVRIANIAKIVRYFVFKLKQLYDNLNLLYNNYEKDMTNFTELINLPKKYPYPS